MLDKIFSQEEFKDNSPKETIKKIKSILKQNNIELKERWHESVAGLYSVNLNVIFQNKIIPSFGSNGKGITKEYALASGYAEFIERLQNLYTKNILEINHPDTEMISKNDFLNQNCIFTNETLSKYLTSYNDNEPKHNLDGKSILEKIYNILSPENEKIACLPFYSIKEEKAVLLPKDLITTINVTTGMCSGNTFNEALVQGLSEVLERYAGYKIIGSKLSPPIIPPEEYLKFPHIKEMINFYNKKGFEIEFRDCSLGKGLPVVCLIVFDKTQHTYTTTFGAHPIFRIAIERCFTEYRLEKDSLILNKDFNFYEFLSYREKDYTNIDLLRNLYDSIFHINWETFLSDSDWEYNPDNWKNNENTNLNFLQKLIKLTLNISDNIYIRDVSFLGFPSYWILVPELSFAITDEQMLKDKILFENIYNKYIKNTDLIKNNITEDILYKAIEYNEKTNLFTREKTVVNGVNNYELGAAFAYVNGNYNQAIKFLESYIADKRTRIHMLNRNNAYAIKDFIALKEKGVKDKKILDILEKAYSGKETSYIKSYWIDKNPYERYIFASQYVNSRIFPSLSKDTPIYMAIRNKCYRNMPQQSNIKSLLESMENQ